MYTKLIIPTIVLLSFLGCKKKDQQVHVPYAPVNITLHVSDPQFFSLNAVGGWTYLNGGSRGILVYRRGNDEFVAFDRHCPYQVESPCGLIEVTSNNFAAVDSCCGSQFSLYDGSVSKGPAVYPLKSYQTFYDGQKLDIYN